MKNILFATKIPERPIALPDQMTWTVPGVYEWIVPQGVYKVSALMIGPGSTGWVNVGSAFGGVGGAVRWKNDVDVTPGQKIQVVVGTGGLQDTITSTGNIPRVENTSSSTIFGIAAGNYATGTPLGNGVGGGNGGVYDVSGYDKFNGGGPVGSVVNAQLPTGQTAPCRGLNPSTMQHVDRTGGVNMGQFAGGGGAAIPASLNGGKHQVWRGGHGAVRVIWGEGRAYPSTKVTNL